MTVAYIRASKVVRKERKPRAKRLAKGHASPYTTSTKSPSFRIAAKKPISLLEPLLHDKTVALSMSVPAPPGAPARRARKDQLVVLTPGPLLGLAKNYALVSVVGKGSCLVGTSDARSISSLVLAGVPLRLSVALMDEFRRVLSRS